MCKVKEAPKMFQLQLGSMCVRYIAAMQNTSLKHYGNALCNIIGPILAN